MESIYDSLLVHDPSRIFTPSLFGQTFEGWNASELSFGVNRSDQDELPKRRTFDKRRYIVIGLARAIGGI
jgi:hypothetical protein